MSAESQVDQAFTVLLGKLHRPEQQPVPRPATVNFEFTAGGTALTVPQSPVLIEIPFPCMLIWAHIYAGDNNGLPVAVTATVDLQVTSLPAFGASRPLYGGAIPSLTAAASADIATTNWLQNLTTGDAIWARLATFTGAATWLTVTLLLRPTEVSIGQNGLADYSGDTLLDTAGNQLVLRT